MPHGEPESTDEKKQTPTIAQNKDESKLKKPNNNATTGASAAGARALLARGVAFYFRAPVKAFFRTRVDYLAYAKSINPRIQSGEYSWRTTTPGLLTHAVKTYGWRFIPDQVLPPLLANTAVGAVLYTSYLQILSALHEPSSQSAKRVYPPPPLSATFTAGCVAGGIQSLVAAPLDALQVRFDSREKHYESKSMWIYGKDKLREIGARGIFAGWGLSFVKDSLGAGIFFCAFEYTKAQAYYRFVARYYGSLEPWMVDHLADLRGTGKANALNRTAAFTDRKPVIKPHWALEPAFLTLAGLTASVSQQVILHPLTKIQTLHYARLEDLDTHARAIQSQKSQMPHNPHSRPAAPMLRACYRAYQHTWQECLASARSSGLGIRRWLYNGFLWNALRQTPATSAGLVVFELVRRRYGVGGEAVRIREDGYDILLE